MFLTQRRTKRVFLSSYILRTHPIREDSTILDAVFGQTRPRR